MPCAKTRRMPPGDLLGWPRVAETIGQFRPDRSEVSDRRAAKMPRARGTASAFALEALTRLALRAIRTGVSQYGHDIVRRAKGHDDGEVRSRVRFDAGRGRRWPPLRAARVLRWLRAGPP